jgi:hypothetical protein
MKKILFILSLSLVLNIAVNLPAAAQCSICTKTAQQMGEKPARGMNSGIIYLALMPFAIVGFIAYRYVKMNRRDDNA